MEIPTPVVAREDISLSSIRG